jgi:hypothetical protein
MFCTLANGALVAGKHDQAHEFIQNARNAMGLLWDSTDPLIASNLISFRPLYMIFAYR